MNGADFKAWVKKTYRSDDAAAADFGISKSTISQWFVRARLTRIASLAAAQKGCPVPQDEPSPHCNNRQKSTGTR